MSIDFSLGLFGKTFSVLLAQVTGRPGSLMSTELFSVGIFFPIQAHVEERGLEISGVGLWSVPGHGEGMLWFDNLWPVRQIAAQWEPRSLLPSLALGCLCQMLAVIQACVA